MASILDDLATLPVNAEFDVPTDQQQDPLPPAPIPEGNYRLKIVGMDLDKRKDGSINLSRDKWPVLHLAKIEVVEGEYAGRVAAMFQRIYSVPFARGGSATPNASALGDLVRAFDQTISAGNVTEAINALHQLVEQGATFRGRIVWTAYDKDAADTKYAELGVTSATASKEQHKAVRAVAFIKGMKKFPQGPNGSYLPVLTGPSGATLEARGELSQVYPSGAEVKL